MLRQISQNLLYDILTPSDRIIALLCLISLLVGLSYITVNAYTTQFAGNLFQDPSWVVLAPMALVMMGLGGYLRCFMPRSGFIIRSFALLFIVATVQQAALAYGIQFTPFPTIDLSLLRADQWLGFDSLAVLQWTHQHPLVLNTLETAYNGLILQLMLVPCLLTLLQQHRALNVFLMAMLMAFLLGTTIYYFFPTIAPAGILQSPYFTEEQLATSLKFFQLHHHLPITTVEGGLIAFPSFHVAWAVLLAYLCRPKAWLFYPMLLLNTLVIAATFMLGWHYLVDALAGIVLAIGAIIVAEKIYARYCAAHEVKELSLIQWPQTALAT